MDQLDRCSGCGRALRGATSTPPCPVCDDHPTRMPDPAELPLIASGSSSRKAPTASSSNWESESAPSEDSLIDGLARALLPDSTDDDSYATAAPSEDSTEANSSRRPFDHAGPLGEAYPDIEGYKILGVLGEGGMGVVYRAIQVGLNRPVALKMIRDASVRPEHLERFRIEAQAVASLHDPNVVQIHDVGEVNGLPYFSIELLVGGTLRERLATASLPEREAAEVVAMIAQGVEAAHRAGIIHRDLKPANILFDAAGVPKVADFGLAKRLDSDGQTLAGQVMGTPSYMAPEQARGENDTVGVRADIYSIGAILYETLAGRPPFKGSNASETLLMVVYQDPVPPSRFRPRLPRDLETICMKCLAKEKERRYASAREVAEDLRRFLAGDPILARPPSTLRLARKWTRKHPVSATLAAMLVLGAVGLVSAVVLEERRVNRVWLEAVDALKSGGELRAHGDLSEARSTLVSLRDRLQRERRLAPLLARAVEELQEVEHAVDVQEAKADGIARLDRFRQLRNQALFAIAYPDESGRGADAARARDEARQALDVFPGAIPTTLEPTQRTEIETGRYQVSLALASALAKPAPGEDPKSQANQALEILDQASKSRTPGPALLLARADCLERRGDREAARDERKKAAGLTPTDAIDFLVLGQERCLEFAWDAARPALEDAIKRDASLFWAHGLLAIADLKSTQPRLEAARSELTFCLAREPRFTGLIVLRGIASTQQGQSLASLAELSPEKDRGPLLEESSRRFDDAEADFGRALELGLTEGNLAYALYTNRGVLRLQRKQNEAALADLREAIRLQPDLWSGHATLAGALRAQGKPDEAVVELGRAIALEPRRPELYFTRALTRLDRQAPPPATIEASVDDLDRASDVEEPGSRQVARYQIRRAELLLALDRPEETLKATARALQIAGDWTQAHVIRVRALMKLRDYKAVVDSCTAALVRAPASAELHQLRGLARFERGEPAEAIEDFTRALGLAIDQKDELLRLRGRCHLTLGAGKLALRDFESVLETDARDASAVAGRAEALVWLGRFREAITYSAATTLARAAAQVGGEAPARGRVAIRDARVLQARASELLAQAVDRTPAAERLAFWTGVVERDPTIRPLLRDPAMVRKLRPVAAGPAPNLEK